MILHNRQHLIDLFEKYAPSKAIRRAIDRNGNIEVLGGFNPLTPSKFPGWVIRLNSPYTDKQWEVALVMRPKDQRLLCFILKEVPWKCWVGENAKNELYRGDKPETYKELKNVN